ncbi:MAG TPA: polysaccharide biosynthesis/export family protein [Thermoanaerobaculia bacterium]|nr:polysaccharide biosynthesis/export family protein [Thermoanaerobaculia bacterium]
MHTAPTTIWKRFVPLLTLAALHLSLFAAPAAALQARSQRQVQGADPQRPGAPVRTAAEDDGSYLIGIGDLLAISVWKHPDLSVEVPVRPDGRVSVPLLGDVVASGLSPLALKDVLARGFAEYVTAPGVAVVIKEIRSQQVFITGEVATPGVYDLRPRTKLMQAIAMAGGLTPYARDRVVVLRDERGRDRRYEIAPSAIISGKRPADNLVLQPGDTIIVP